MGFLVPGRFGSLCVGMRRFGLALVSLAALSACETYSDVATKPPDAQVEVSRNYQAVYAGILDRLRACDMVGQTNFPAAGESTLDAQLYPDLGYGEVIVGMSSLVPVTYSRTVVRRQGNGAIVTITVGNVAPWAKETSVAWLSHWARGGRECPGALVRGRPPTT
jgi:hypothetical protein